MTGTFVDNEGNRHPNSTAIKIDDNTFVFGAVESGWFKMVAVGSDGLKLETRYFKDGLYQANNASKSVINNWKDANRGGGYKVKDLKRNPCEGIVCFNTVRRAFRVGINVIFI